MIVRREDIEQKILARDFYANVISIEQKCLQFLRDHNDLAGGNVYFSACSYDFPMK